MKPIYVCCFVLWPVLALAASPAQGERIARLQKSVLAPCCYAETVAVHQSEIAVKIRMQIADWVGQGRTDAQILDTYAAQFGAKVLVNPDVAPQGWSYAVPWAVTVLGVAFGGAVLWRWRRTGSGQPSRSGAPHEPLPELPDFDRE